MYYHVQRCSTLKIETSKYLNILYFPVPRGSTVFSQLRGCLITSQSSYQLLVASPLYANVKCIHSPGHWVCWRHLLKGALTWDVLQALPVPVAVPRLARSRVVCCVSHGSAPLDLRSRGMIYDRFSVQGVAYTTLPTKLIKLCMKTLNFDWKILRIYSWGVLQHDVEFLDVLFSYWCVLMFFWTVWVIYRIITYMNVKFSQCGPGVLIGWIDTLFKLLNRFECPGISLSSLIPLSNVLLSSPDISLNWQIPIFTASTSRHDDWPPIFCEPIESAWKLPHGVSEK